MPSVDEIYRQAREIVTARQKAYGDGWEREGLQDLYTNIVRKAKHLEFLSSHGKEYDESAKEAILDTVNYCTFAFYHLSKMKVPLVKLGLDCPTSWLGLVQPLGDFDYVLVDKVLRDPIYLDYFKTSPRPKVLNNRLIGTGMPVALGDIKEVWGQLGGMVIASDWMNDHIRTLGAYEECCRAFGSDNVVGVLQGVSDQEVKDCLDLYGERVAVPFDVGSRKEESAWVKACRRALVTYSLGERKVHLLGLTNPKELEFYRECPNIESLNTGLPMLLAFKGQSLTYSEKDKASSSYHDMDMGSPPVNYQTFKLLEDNIRELRGLLR